MEVRPDSLATGRPITVVVPAATVGELRVVPLKAGAAQAFEVPMKEISGEKVGQFLLSLPGSYRLEMAGDQKEIVVPLQENLSLGLELGIFFFVVTLTVLRMVLWMRKRPKPQ